jgi:hypothetical protein
MSKLVQKMFKMFKMFKNDQKNVQKNVYKCSTKAKEYGKPMLKKNNVVHDVKKNIRTKC